MKLLKPTRSRFNLWVSLGQAKNRKRANLFLAEGVKVVSELLRSDWPVRSVLVLEERKDRLREVAAACSGRADLYGLTKKQWQDVSQDKQSEGLIAVASVPAMPALGDLAFPGFDRLLLLHEINNPNNLGALLRTADWFGFKAVLLSRNSVDFTHPKAVRTAMGSLFHLPVLADLDFLRILPALRRSHRLIAGAAGGGAAPHAGPGPTALLLGSESHGLPGQLSEMADEIWSIPGGGQAESLSLPQAAAVLMYLCAASS